MYRIGVVGDYDSICGFSAVGMDIFPIEDIEEAKKKLRELSMLEYGIIYVTEPIIEMLPEEYARYEEMMTPAIIPIPSFGLEKGMAIEMIRNYVKQAVGSDIIFNDGK